MYLFQCPHIAKLWSELKVSQEKNIRAEALWNYLETLNLPMAAIASVLGKAKQNHFETTRVSFEYVSASSESRSWGLAQNWCVHAAITFDWTQESEAK
jgi:hypothetical protein